MTYIAFLRGINVGGNRKVEMRVLREVFEQAGMRQVRTYINSGNVIFETDEDASGLGSALERAIEARFGFEVPVIVRSAAQIRALVGELPETWANDETAKCDVIVLGPEMDRPDILDELVIRDGIDDARYVPGALLWRVERPNITRSGLMRLVGSDLYVQSTVRNCNTIRKLAALAGEPVDGDAAT